MKRRALFTCVLLALVGLIVPLCLFLDYRADPWHRKVRRELKQTMTSAIHADVVNDKKPPEPRDGDWLSERLILCEDGAWFAYRASCEKTAPGIADIFIARASNGGWYYSTFHFCVDAMVLRSDDQPKSLEEFIHRYSLVEFDGVSDVALNRTWDGKFRLTAP